MTTRLIQATINGQYQAVKEYLEAGDNVNDQCSDWGSALIAAIYKNQFEIAKLLVFYGADLYSDYRVYYSGFNNGHDAWFWASRMDSKIKDFIEPFYSRSKELNETAYHLLSELSGFNQKRDNDFFAAIRILFALTNRSYWKYSFTSLASKSYNLAYQIIAKIYLHQDVSQYPNFSAGLINYFGIDKKQDFLLAINHFKNSANDGLSEGYLWYAMLLMEEKSPDHVAIVKALREAHTRATTVSTEIMCVQKLVELQKKFPQDRLIAATLGDCYQREGKKNYSHQTLLDFYPLIDRTRELREDEDSAQKYNQACYDLGELAQSQACYNTAFAYFILAHNNKDQRATLAIADAYSKGWHDGSHTPNPKKAIEFYLSIKDVTLMERVKQSLQLLKPFGSEIKYGLSQAQEYVNKQLQEYQVQCEKQEIAQAIEALQEAKVVDAASNAYNILEKYKNKIETQQLLEYTKTAAKLSVPSAILNLGKSCHQERNFPQAIMYFKQACQSASEKPKALLLLKDIINLESKEGDNDQIKMKDDALSALLEFDTENNYLEKAKIYFDKMQNKPADWKAFFSTLDNFEKNKNTDFSAAIKAILAIKPCSLKFAKESFLQQLADQKDNAAYQVVAKKLLNTEYQNEFTQGICAYFGLNEEKEVDYSKAASAFWSTTELNSAEGHFWYAMVLNQMEKPDYQAMAQSWSKAHELTQNPTIRTVSRKYLEKLQTQHPEDFSLAMIISECYEREAKENYQSVSKEIDSLALTLGNFFSIEGQAADSKEELPATQHHELYFQLGMLAENQKNYKTAFAYFELAHQCGNLKATLAMAEAYHHGRLSDNNLPNITKAIELYSHVVQHGEYQSKLMSTALNALTILKCLAPNDVSLKKAFNTAQFKCNLQKLESLFDQWIHDKKTSDSLLAFCDENKDYDDARFKLISGIVALHSQSVWLSSHKRLDLSRRIADLFSLEGKLFLSATKTNDTEAMKELALIRFYHDSKNRVLFWAFTACACDRLLNHSKKELRDYCPKEALSNKSYQLLIKEYEALLQQLPKSISTVSDLWSSFSYYPAVSSALKKEKIVLSTPTKECVTTNGTEVQSAYNPSASSVTSHSFLNNPLSSSNSPPASELSLTGQTLKR